LIFYTWHLGDFGYLLNKGICRRNQWQIIEYCEPLEVSSNQEKEGSKEASKEGKNKGRKERTKEGRKERRKDKCFPA
jgi:hypothetical protein